MWRGHPARVSAEGNAGETPTPQVPTHALSAMDEPVIQTPCGPVTVRRGTAAEVVDLRHQLLRAGLPRETAIFDGDEHPDARHVVGITSEGRIVGCATVHPGTRAGAPAWQLRGMATDPPVRGCGVGRAMLTYLADVVYQEFPFRPMWCNARLPAIGFYKRQGWEPTGEPFEIPTAGPHVRMVRVGRG